MTDLSHAPERTAALGSPDDLLLCLQFLARHYERPSSETALTAGLPLVEGRLTPELVPTAAARIGLGAKILKRSLAELTPLYLPCIVFTSAGRAVALLECTAATCRVYAPDFDSIMEAPRVEIEDHYSGLAITISPLFGRGAVDPGVPTALQPRGIGSSALSRSIGGVLYRSVSRRQSSILSASPRRSSR